MDRGDALGDPSRVAAGRLGEGQVEERRVALELGEPQRGCRRVDHDLEQPRDDLLRVRETRMVELHEPRVAGDVGDQQQRGLDRHGPPGRPRRPAVGARARRGIPFYERDPAPDAT